MFENNLRIFKVWAYTVSHSFLVIRSPLLSSDDEVINPLSVDVNWNIDIEFYAVSYLDIPSVIKGIRITEVTNRVPVKFETYIQMDYRLFKIESEGKSYFIVAGGFLVGKNKWLSGVSPTTDSSHDQIIISYPDR